MSKQEVKGVECEEGICRFCGAKIGNGLIDHVCYKDEWHTRGCAGGR